MMTTNSWTIGNGKKKGGKREGREKRRKKGENFGF